MNNTRSVMKLPLFFELSGFLWIVAFALFSLNQDVESDYTKLVSMTNIVWHFAMWYSFCRLSEEVTSCPNGILEAFYNLDWFLMSTVKRKALVLMLVRTQEKFCFTCLGFFDCSLTLFSAVIFEVHKMGHGAGRFSFIDAYFFCGFF